MARKTENNQKENPLGYTLHTTHAWKEKYKIRLSTGMSLNDNYHNKMISIILDQDCLM